MGNFDERVRKVVDEAIEHHMETHSEAESPQASIHTPDDIYDAVMSLRNLTADVKTEVFKVEHNIPSQKQDEGDDEEENPEDTRDLLKRLKRWLDDGKEAAEAMGYGENLAPEIFDDWMDRLSKLIPLIKRVGNTTKFIINNIIRSWMLSEKLKPIKRAIDDISSDVNKSSSVILSKMSTDTKSLRDAIDRNNVHLSNIEQELITCCQNTASLLGNVLQNQDQMESILEGIDQTTADTQSTVNGVNTTTRDIKSKVEGVDDTTRDIQRKVNALQPESTSNNSLELLQRQKAIQATLEDIRGLL